MLNDIIGLFFPKYCITCHNPLIRGEKPLCTECISQLPKNKNYSKANEAHKIVSTLLPNCDGYYFLSFEGDGMTRKILHEIKYSNNTGLAHELGYVFSQELKKHITLPHAVIPVPLHPDKFKSRGYNQSMELAKGITKGLKVPIWDNMIERTKHTETQTKKNRMDRILNVEDLFSIKEAQKLQGKHILLVDDVLTTGATIGSMIDSLKDSGVKKISTAFLAYAK